jgi:hypothetical protein
MYTLNNLFCVNGSLYLFFLCDVSNGSIKWFFEPINQTKSEERNTQTNGASVGNSNITHKNSLNL